MPWKFRPREPWEREKDALKTTIVVLRRELETKQAAAGRLKTLLRSRTNTIDELRGKLEQSGARALGAARRRSRVRTTRSGCGRLTDMVKRDTKLQQLLDENDALRMTVVDRDQTIERLKTEIERLGLKERAQLKRIGDLHDRIYESGDLASPPATAYDEPVPISVLRSGIVDGSSIRTGQSKRNYHRAWCALARSPNCASTLNPTPLLISDLVLHLRQPEVR